MFITLLLLSQSERSNQYIIFYEVKRFEFKAIGWFVRPIAALGL